MDTPYLTDKDVPTSQFKFKYLLIYCANKMAAETKVKLIPNRKLNFQQCTRYRQRHTATVMTIGNYSQ